MKWYYVTAGNRSDPCDLADLQELVGNGTLSQDTLVWNDSMGTEWARVCDVPALAKEESSPPPITPVAEEKKPRSKLRLMGRREEIDEELTETALFADEERLNIITDRIVDLLEEGYSRKEVISELAVWNIEEETGIQLVSEINKMRHSAYRRMGAFHMVLGIGSIAIGLGLSIALAKLLEEVGFYVLFYGLVLGGIIEMLNGLRYLLFGALKKIIWVPIIVTITLIAGGIGLYITLKHFGKI